MLPAARQRQSRRPVEVDGRLRKEDRRQRARHRAQRQPEQRHDVPRRRGLRQERSTASMPRQRAKWERLYEATQTKGDGEAHPFLSPNDEFADFELWDKGNLDGSVAEDEGDARVRVRPLGAEERPQARSRSSARIPTSSAWSAAATRTPASPRWRRTTSSARPRRRSPARDRHDRHLHEQPEDRREDHGLGGRRLRLRRGVGRRRTRASRIWDAMERKETYATTGSRMIVRFFGGWDFEASRRATRASPPQSATRKGVPMGGDLRAAPAGQGADLPRRRAARTRSAATSTASRSSRAGSTRRASCTRRSTTSSWSGDRKPDANGKLPQRRQHRGRRERHLDQHHRRARADHGLEGPGLRRRSSAPSTTCA